MFSRYCSEKYLVEYCEVEEVDGTVSLYPELRYRDVIVSVEKANSYIGIQ